MALLVSGGGDTVGRRPSRERLHQVDAREEETRLRVALPERSDALGVGVRQCHRSERVS